MRKFNLRRRREKECVAMEQQNSNERSKYNEHIPRYYKGYDVDIILEKSFCQRIVGDERAILDEIVCDYYNKEYERVKLGNKREAIHPLLVNGKEIYRSGTMINNPFLKLSTLSKNMNRGNNQ